MSTKGKLLSKEPIVFDLLNLNPKQDGICQTLNAYNGTGGNNMPIVMNENKTVIIENHPADSRVKICEDNVFQTLSSRMGTGGNNVPMVMESKEPILLESTQNHATIQTDGVSTTLPASMGMGGGYTPMVLEDKEIAYGIEPGAAQRLDPQNRINMGDNQASVCKTVVRRLTPLECERLQNYPDGWTDIGEWVDSKGKKHKDADSPRYKALGNSIALPFWEWMAERICKQYERPVKLGSLFDGIGGFPLVFSRHGGIPVWASEIEEFCIAVTKKRFADQGEVDHETDS